METKEDALQEMKTWQGVNKYLYKRALYAYADLPSKEEKDKLNVQVKKETKVSIPKEKIKEVKPKYTKEELKDLTKSEQVKILNDLGETKIPRLEGGRVNRILELTE